MTGRSPGSKPLNEMLRLDGSTAVVTGSGRGIGAAIVSRLTEAGARVVGVDIEPDGSVGAAGPEEFVSADLCDPDAADEVAAAARDSFGSIDIWVNNAGIYPVSDLLELSDEEFDRVLAVNLKATFSGARAAARVMKDSGRGGVIVNIASNAGMAAGAGTAHYVASKHGVVGLTKSLAVDLAPHGIRAVGVAPGVTRTEGIEAASRALRDAGWGELEEYVARSTPLGRMAEPDEIARVVVFAASELAAYVTGTTILVDGGQVVSFT